jgi:spermidine/putrescine transport system ATP-binding protein
MIRPEKLKVLKSNPTPDQNYVEGVLKEVLYLGATTQYQVQIKEGSAPMIAVLSNSALTARKNFASGEKVYLAWHPEDCLLVNGGNGGSNGGATVQ